MLQLHNLPMFAIHIQCKKTNKHFQSFARDTCNEKDYFQPFYLFLSTKLV